MDKRIASLSYSSGLLAHSCPRKYQLVKLSSQRTERLTRKQSLTFDFGHMVGDGIAMLFSGVSLEDAIWKLFVLWPNEGILDWDDDKNKSFFHGVDALMKFENVRQQLFDEYEVLQTDRGPAIELGFYLSLPNGMAYRGFVDIVLRHKHTGEIRCIEVKTNSAVYVNPAQYKNSSQAIGYSLILDHIAPEVSSYDVTYLVYSTKKLDYEVFDFNKTYQARARWIRELILDARAIQEWDAADFYPTRGEHCITYGRECDFLGMCHMETKQLVDLEGDPPEEEDISKYEFHITLEELIKTQLEKTGAAI